MSDGFRILVLEPSGNLWGSERVLLDFLALASRQCQVAICYPRGSPIAAELAALPVATYPWFIASLHRKPRLLRLLALGGVILAAFRFRPDVIYVNQAGASRIALWGARLLSLSVVTHVRLTQDVDYIERLCSGSRFSGAAVTISNYILNAFSRSGIVPRNQLHTLYDPYQKQFAWHGAGVPASPVERGEHPRLACVARLAEKKGQDVLLKAVAVLKSEQITVQVTFVGNASEGQEAYAEKLLTLAQDLGIGEQLAWAGYQSNVFPRSAGSIAWICPSWEEALGRVIFEAWDAGSIPIAWAGSGGAAEVIAASGGGVLYEKQDGESLAQSMKQVMQYTPVEHAERVERGRRWVSANCDPARYAASLLAIMKEAAAHE